MHRPAQIFTIAATITAFTALLVSQAGQLAPAALVVAVGLMLIAVATTVHAILRPVERRTIDESYVSGYARTSRRLTRSH